MQYNTCNITFWRKVNKNKNKNKRKEGVGFPTSSFVLLCTNRIVLSLFFWLATFVFFLMLAFYFGQAADAGKY